MCGQLIIFLVTMTGVIGGRPDAFAAAAQKPVLWVLSIGVSRYQDNALNLQFADADAKAISTAFDTQRDNGIYRETKTLTLTNEQVTRDSILNSMSRFLGQAGPDDIVVIFVAGHGVQDRSTGSYYFLPATATKENHVTAGVRMSDFDEMLRVVRQSVRGVVLMMDTCHSGALRVGAPGLVSMDDPAARLTASEGFFLLAATKPGEESKEYPSLRHGAFTYALLEGLQGKADADGDGIVSVSELFGYVTRAVAEISSDTQHPYSKVEGTDLRLVSVRPGATVLPRPSLTKADSSAAAVPNTIAVMEFSNVRNDTDHDWVGSALRVAFNTELNKVGALNVYAPELIDRLIKTRGVDQLSAAQQLQIDRLVTGSFSVVGTAIRIDARIIYAESGLQEGSDSVQGELNDFFDLQKRLVLSMLRRLRVNPSPEEGQSIGKKSTSDVNAYRLLLESEDLVDAPPAKPTATPRARTAPRRRSALENGLPLVSGWFIGTAEAQTSGEPREAEVLALMQSYREALEARDLDRLATLYVEFPQRRRDTLRQYFESSRNLKVEIADVKLTPQGDDFIVSYTRRDSFIDEKSGKPVELEVRLTRLAVRLGDTWRMAGKP